MMSKKLFVLLLILLFPAGQVRSSRTGSTTRSQNTPPLSCTPPNPLFAHNFMLTTTQDNSLFKGTDRGWEKLSPPTTGDIEVDPKDTIYLLRHYQSDVRAPLYRSTDGGETWSRQGEGWFDKIDPSPKPDWVCAASGYNDARGGIYRSTDGGVTGKQVSFWRATSLSFSPAFAEDGIAFAIALGSIVKTNTAGETWFGMSPSQEQKVVKEGNSTKDAMRPQRPWDFGWVVVSSQFPQDHTVFAGGGFKGTYKTTDGGDTWFKVPDTWAPAFSPHYATDHTLLAGGDGIYLSRDGGLTWQRIGSGNVYAVGIREQGPFGSPAVTPSPPPGPHFLYVPFLGRASGALEFWVVRAPQEGGNCYLYRSRDEGATWQEVSVFEAAHWQYLPWVSRGPAP